MSISLALLAALFAALTSILEKVGIQNIDANLATALRTIVILLMAVLVVVITGQWNDIFTIAGPTMLFIILSGITTGLSWICFFKAIQIGDVSKVVPIDKASIVITILLSFLILKERPSKSTLFGGSVITLGTLTCMQGNNRWLFPSSSFQKNNSCFIVFHYIFSFPY